jgi:hypothetical protein
LPSETPAGLHGTRLTVCFGCAVVCSFRFVSMVHFLPSETPAGLHGTRLTVFFGCAVVCSFQFVSMVRFLPSETPAGLHGTRLTVFCVWQQENELSLPPVPLETRSPR